MKNPSSLGNLFSSEKHSEFTEVSPAVTAGIVMSEKITAQVGDKQIIIETGKLAKTGGWRR